MITAKNVEQAYSVLKRVVVRTPWIIVDTYRKNMVQLFI